MTTSSSNNIKDRSETSVDYELICTICNKPFNGSPSFPCGHTFCRRCIRQEIEENHVTCPTCQQGVTINKFSEVNYTVRKNVNDLPMKYNEDKQTTLHSQNTDNPINEASSAIDEHNLSSNIALDQNEQQNQYSAARLFEPFRDLLSDLINQNKHIKEEINQLKKQSQLQLNEQSKKNEELQLELNQLKEQSIFAIWIATITGIFLLFYFFSVAYSNQGTTIKQIQLQHQNFTEQLKNVNNQYDLCVKQLNEQLKKNEKLQLELNKLTEQSEIQLAGNSRKNEELQIAVNQIREQSETQLTRQSKRNEELQFRISQLREQNRLKLTEQSRKNENLQLAVNQLTGQSELQVTEQSRKNEDLQLACNQIKEHSQLQHQNFTEQLKNVNNQYDLCVKRLNEQSKKNEELQLELNQLKEQSQLQVTGQSRKNEELQLDINQLTEPRILAIQIATITVIFLFFYFFFVAYSNRVTTIKQSQLQLSEQSKKNEEPQLELDRLKEQSQLQVTGQSRKNEELQLDINQLNEKSAEHSTLINRLQTDDQNQSAQILETNQQHNILEKIVKFIRDYMRYLPGEYIMIFQCRKHC
jgi:hypothetical protein